MPRATPLRVMQCSVTGVAVCTNMIAGLHQPSKLPDPFANVILIIAIKTKTKTQRNNFCNNLTTRMGDQM